MLGAIITSFLNKEQDIKRLALIFTILTIMVSLFLWETIDFNSGYYVYTNVLDYLSFCNFTVGVDGLSIYFVLRTTFPFLICVLASWINIKINLKSFLVYLLLLEGLLICLFVVTDLLLFYVFFESVLIPLFIIVGTWGSSKPEVRKRASYLLFLYTLFGSLFMLLAFLALIIQVGGTDFKLLSLIDISFENQKWLFLAIFLSFAIKQPLVPFHIWLNRAHAEAPLAGSMILAGLILKLATYGFLRVILPYLPESSHYLSPILQVLAIFTLIFSSLTTIRQSDIKIMVAYSSVGHMALVLIGLFSNTQQGIEGAILLSIAHGLVSPALFMCIGGVLYDRFHIRNIYYYRGLILSMPIFSTLFFLFILGNTGTPLTINWIGEFLSVIGAVQHSLLVGVLMSLGVVLSAGYSMWLYTRICGGQSSISLDYHLDLNRREFIILFTLVVFTYLFGVLPNEILLDLNGPVSSLLNVLD